MICNHKNYENFQPRKFGTTWYLYMAAIVSIIGTVGCNPLINAYWQKFCNYSDVIRDAQILKLVLAVA